MTRKRRIILVVSAACVVSTLVVGSLAMASRHGVGPSVSPPDPQTLLELKTKALAFAAAQGEPSPTGAVVGASQRIAVQTLMGGADVVTDNDSYVVALHGTFTASNASVLPGASVPSGTDLVLIYSVSTGELTDWSLSRSQPDLAQFGTPLSLN